MQAKKFNEESFQAHTQSPIISRIWIWWLKLIIAYSDVREISLAQKNNSNVLKTSEPTYHNTYHMTVFNLILVMGK